MSGNLGTPGWADGIFCLFLSTACASILGNQSKVMEYPLIVICTPFCVNTEKSYFLLCFDFLCC